jgi:hypothetical protein
MNEIKKTDLGEDIYFQDHVARSIRRGDVILRPIIAESVFDRLINWIMPGNFEHAMLYIGDGKLLNPYPDKNNYLHKEDLLENFSWYEEISNNPKLLTFARITNNEEIIEKTISEFQSCDVKKIKHQYCTRAIIQSFILSGIPAEKFQVTKTKGNPFSAFFVKSFDTGYEISLAAEILITFEALQD